MKKRAASVAWQLEWLFCRLWMKAKYDNRFLHAQFNFWQRVRIRLDPDSIPF